MVALPFLVLVNFAAVSAARKADWVRFAAFALFCGGAWMNWIVVIGNCWKMPTTRPESCGLLPKGYCRVDGVTKCAWLADRIKVGSWAFASFGDCLMAAGLVILTIYNLWWAFS
jgi:hypothetical protein